MKPKTILIFDQEEAVRDSLRLVLTEEGFSCYTAETVAEALNHLAERTIDMMIMDSQLIGAGFIKSIRQNYARMLIMVMSTYSDFETTLQSVFDGAHNFVLKPLDFDELIAKIKRLLPVTSE